MYTIKFKGKIVVALTIKSNHIGPDQWMCGDRLYRAKVFAHLDDGSRMKVSSPNELSMEPCPAPGCLPSEFTGWHNLKRRTIRELFNAERKEKRSELRGGL